MTLEPPVAPVAMSANSAQAPDMGHPDSLDVAVQVDLQLCLGDDVEGRTKSKNARKSGKKQHLFLELQLFIESIALAIH